MTKVSIHFDLPFYLKMSGLYKVKLDDKIAEVTLTEHKKEQITMPGLSEAKNISLVFDDTSHFRYSKVKIDVELPTPTKDEVGDFTQKLIPEISLKIINRVISIYRDVSEDFIIPELPTLGQIVIINFIF